jgi:hypothetical protein
LRVPTFINFFTIPGKEKKIVVKAYFLLVIIRLGLWLVPFKMLQSLLDKLSRHSGNTIGWSAPPEKVAWAVHIASRYVPYATCLSQALTVQALLAQEGIHSDLEIGVARDDGSRIKAHAWLEIDGTVIIGAHELDQYTRLIQRE